MFNYNICEEYKVGRESCSELNSEITGELVPHQQYCGPLELSWMAKLLAYEPDLWAAPERMTPQIQAAMMCFTLLSLRNRHL